MRPVRPVRLHGPRENQTRGGPASAVRPPLRRIPAGRISLRAQSERRRDQGLLLSARIRPLPDRAPAYPESPQSGRRRSLISYVVDIRRCSLCEKSFKLELFIPILKDAIHPIEQENRQLKLVHSTGFDLPCTVDWRRLRM